MDVAEALATMLNSPVTSVASTFALPGPAVHNFNSLQNLPKAVAMLGATILNRALWWPTTNPDEIERKFINDFGVEAFEKQMGESKPAGWLDSTAKAHMSGVDGEPIKGFGDLNIDPDHIEEHAIKYLRRYRSA
jgi:NADH dehydrogenase (ubiquinone) 1 alpha subcomplex subunit 9